MSTVIATPHAVKNPELADQGRKRIEWANQSMPVLQSVRKEFIKHQPLKDIKIAACLHVTPETANLIITLRDGGAELALCAANASSTHDDVAACLARDYGIATYAIQGEEPALHTTHANAVLDLKPNVIMDTGCTLVQLLHSTRGEGLEGIQAVTEEAPTGILRLRAMAKEGSLPYPVMAVNEGITKNVFDNRYGTGQSTLDGIIRSTNVLLAGSKFVVVGYGWCGRGLAARARGMGADVIVTEVDPIKALEAVMDGYRVMSMVEAAKIGDILVTVTGNKGVIRLEHFEQLKNGAILANSGYSNIEIDLPALSRAISSKRLIREGLEEYVLRDGRKIYLLCEGRIVNHSAAAGNPSSVKDLSLANHALAVDYLVKGHAGLEKKVYSVPQELDAKVARLKLESMSIKIDRLTPEQEEYLASWAGSL